MGRLREVLDSGDYKNLKYLVRQALDHDLHHAEWPELYDLYRACQALANSAGCRVVLDQLPEPGDPSIKTLLVDDYVRILLLRGDDHHNRGRSEEAKALFAMAAKIAKDFGEDPQDHAAPKG
jgi:hypothetical protein